MGLREAACLHGVRRRARLAACNAVAQPCRRGQWAYVRRNASTQGREDEGILVSFEATPLHPKADAESSGGQQGMAKQQHSKRVPPLAIMGGQRL